MPTYEYVCRSCRRGLEAVQGFDDPALTTCEVCGGSLKKVYGAVGIVFKGSGFYKTDSRSGSSSSKTASVAPGSDSTKPAVTNNGTAAPSSDKAAPASGESTKPTVKEPAAKP